MFFFFRADGFCPITTYWNGTTPHTLTIAELVLYQRQYQIMQCNACPPNGYVECTGLGKVWQQTTIWHLSTFTPIVKGAVGQWSLPFCTVVYNWGPEKLEP